MNNHVHPVMHRALAPFIPAMKPDEYYLPDNEGWDLAHQQQLDEQQQQDEGWDD